MKIKSISYFFKQAGLSVLRNGWMSIASLMTVVISLVTLGGFLLVGMNIDNIARSVEDNVELVVWVDTATIASDVQYLGRQLAAITGVNSVQLVTKEEGLAKINQQYGDQDLLLSLEGENPLPDYYIVKTRDAGLVGQVAETAARLPYVESVDYGQQEVDRLFAILKWVRMFGYGTAVMLAIASVALVAITIRLTVFARQREIEIMKYVGATDTFIRAPFLLEGVLLGFVGALLASTLLYAFYGYLVAWIGAQLTFLPFVSDLSVILHVLTYLVIGGSVLGGLGSVISVQRYLRV